MKYVRVNTQTNVRRSFRIVCGLREGYKQDAVVYDPIKAIEIVHLWMRNRAENDQPFLTGLISEETLVYTWKGANGDDAAEPAVVFQGEVSITYSADLSDDQVKGLLEEIAVAFGAGFRQTRVYIAYRDETWVIQAEGKFSPRVK